MKGEYYTKWQTSPRVTDKEDAEITPPDSDLNDSDDDANEFLVDFAETRAALGNERSRDWLREYGLDDEALEPLNPLERARIAIVQLAEQVKSREQFKSSDIFSRSDNPRFTPETDRVYALQQRAEEILVAELRSGTIDMATVVNLIDSKGINAVSQLEHVNNMVINERHTQYPDDIFYAKEGRHYRQNSPATPLEVDYVKALHELTGSLSSKDTNYFFKASITAFIARWQDNHESVPSEENMFGFYEIEKNRLAVITQNAVMFRGNERGGSEDLLTEIRELNQLLLSAESGLLDNRLDSIEQLADDIGDWSGVNMLHAAEFKNVPPELIGNYVRMLQPETRRILENDFNITLKSLSIEEQLHCLNYLKQTTVGSVETMRTFIQFYGITGMRTFLALEQGGEDLGDKIVSFGQYPDLAKKVFGYYTELLDTANNAEELVRSRLGEQADIETTKQTIDAVRADILSTAQRDLERAVKAGDPHEIFKKIETFSASARVYVTLLKEVARTPLESVLAVSLDDNFKMAARRLSEQNYANETPEFQAIIQKSLDDAFLRNNTRFYTEVDDDGQIIFFDRFDTVFTQEGKKVTYFGSVNSDPAYAGIGKIRIGETLEKELKDCDVMYAHCDPRNPISQFYIEHGFVATQTVAPAGKFSFEIWRSEDSSKTLKTKNMTQEELEALANTSISTDSDYFVREVEPKDQFLELDSGLAYLLTRYFTIGGKTYAAFELNASVGRSFVAPESSNK